MFDLKIYKEYYKKHEEKILYLIFGFLTTLVHLVSYKIFLNMGIQYLLGTNIAFVLAVLFAFFTNKHIVFKKGNNVIREFFLFIGARIITQLINNFGLIFAVEVLNIDAFLSQVFLSVIVIILNYIFSKYAIFVHK